MYKQGVAVKPVPLAKLNARIFINRISELISQESLYTNARRISEKIRAENGVEKAVDLVEKIISRRLEQPITQSAITQIAS